MPANPALRLVTTHVDGRPGFVLYNGQAVLGSATRTLAGWRCQINRPSGHVEHVQWHRRTMRQAVDRITGFAT